METSDISLAETLPGRESDQYHRKLKNGMVSRSDFGRYK